MKLEFLLFKETVGEMPYRDLHLWIDVNKTGATEANRTLNISGWNESQP
jgi:hypothetical protein